MAVKQIINGQRVSVHPVYRGGVQPASCAGTVNQRILPRHLKAPTRMSFVSSNGTAERRV